MKKSTSARQSKAVNTRGIVRLISGSKGLIIEPTNGNDTIANAHEVFTRGIDGSFTVGGCAIKSKPTKKGIVEVYEMFEEGTSDDMFYGINGNLDDLCLTQPQIIQFVEKHKQWLRQDGNGTFFLIKVGEQHFIVAVGLGAGDKPYAGMSELFNSHVWPACQRVVVPRHTRGR